MKTLAVIVTVAVLASAVMAVSEHVSIEEPFRRPGGGGGGGGSGGGGGGSSGGGSRPPPPVAPTPDSGNSSEDDSSDSKEDAYVNPCKGLLIGILEHPSSCYKYISCYKEVATEETCPPDTIFDLDEITCVPGNQRTCRKEGDPYPLPTDMCRGIVLGTMVHPEDCNKYVSCLLGRAR